MPVTSDKAYFDTNVSVPYYTNEAFAMCTDCTDNSYNTTERSRYNIQGDLLNMTSGKLL